ncbi:unnamed protein product [Larinioides sclopetarius]|uniref:RING-type domain-containing protein n=1 Tax=Larinioides sclopetarius TaxID=280406 RepID=A0AAV2BHV1_9ARAC
MENTANLNPSCGTLSSVLSGKVTDNQSTIVRDASTSGEHLPSSTRSQSGNLSRSCGSSVTSVVLRTVTDNQSTIVRDESTSGEHLPSCTRSQSGNLNCSCETTVSSLETTTFTDTHSAIVQDGSTRGGLLRRTSSSSSGNLNRSPGTTTDDLIVTDAFVFSPPLILPVASTSAGSQPLSTRRVWTFTRPEFECSLCANTIFREGQIKRLRCNHAFHQSCIDMWLNGNRNCPICLTPFRRVRRHRKKRRNGRPHINIRLQGTRRLL